MKRQLEPEVMDDAHEAAEYDAMNHTVPNTAFVERLLELGAKGRMLDIGTGPGHIPLLLCERDPAAHVLGIDLSRNMIALAERRRTASAHADRMEFLEAGARALPFADASFDAVFSNTVIHHIEDPRPALREAWRVLKSDGVFLIRDLFRPPDNDAVERLVSLHAAGETAEQQQLLRQSLQAAFTPEEMRDLIDDLGFDGVEVVVDSDRHASMQRRAGRAAG